MISRCSLISQHEGPGQSPVNVGCSTFKDTNKDQSNNSAKRHEQKN